MFKNLYISHKCHMEVIEAITIYRDGRGWTRSFLFFVLLSMKRKVRAALHKTTSYRGALTALFVYCVLLTNRAAQAIL